jgi:uncharacterized protein (TIGR02466 family)
MKMHSYFPTTIYQSKIFSSTSQINKDLFKECHKFREIDKQGIQWSKKNYPGGYTSYGSLSTLHQISPTFEILKIKIDSEVKKYIKILDMDVNQKDIQICSMWINIMPPGTTHTMHIHPLSVISGTYYLQVPKGARGLKFEDPRLSKFMATPPRKTNAKIQNKWFIELKPQVGDIVLFESWVRHEVPPNPVAKERISISFNYNWV